jgi:hypothetical protein
VTRYLIVRTFEVEKEQLPELGRRSRRVAAEQFPEVVWEHSHVVADEDGTLKSFCVYGAPSEDVLREHAAVLGEHRVEHVYEIGGDVTPNDFPL